MPRYTRLDCPHSYKKEEGVLVGLPSEDPYKRIVLYYTVCNSCAKDYKKRGVWLVGEEEISQYLNSR